MLWHPHLLSLRKWQTISVLDVGDTLNWVSMPLITSVRTPCEMFTKQNLSVKMLECRAPGDIPNVNHPGDNSRTSSQRPAMASTNSCNKPVQLQLNKLKSNRFNGKSQRLTTTSTNGLSHVTIDRIYLNTEETGGLACEIGLQCIKSWSNSLGGLRVPMSAMGNPDGPTTWAPAWRQRMEAVKESVDASNWSDGQRSCYQSNLTLNLEFGGERIKADIRSNEKQINEDGLTSKKVPRQLLDASTWNMHLTGKVDGCVVN